MFFSNLLNFLFNNVHLPYVEEFRKIYAAQGLIPEMNEKLLFTMIGIEELILAQLEDYLLIIQLENYAELYLNENRDSITSR
jgi:hypothetical protein